MANPVTVVHDRTGEVMRLIKSLSRKRVMIGIPRNSGKNKRDDMPITNAELGFIHEFGSPANNIPARAFLVPGVSSIREQGINMLKLAGQRALEGDAKAVENTLTAIGFLGENAAKKKLETGPFIPLADATVAARARKGRAGAAEELASRRAGNPPSNALVKPLIDTGQLLGAITHVIRIKGE